MFAHGRPTAGAVLLWTAIAGLAGCSRGIVRPPEPVLRIAVDSSNPVLQLPVYVAVRERLFAGERLRMTLVESRDAGEATAAVSRGDCQFASAGFEHVLRSCQDGKPLTAVALLCRSPMLLLASWGQLRPPRGGPAAEKVGVVRPGDASDLFAHYLTRGTAVARESMAEVLNAFAKRQVGVAVLDAAAAYEVEARRAPMTVLADTRTLAGLLAVYGVSDYPGSCIYAQPSFIAAHDDQMRRMGNSIARSLAWIRQHSAADCIRMLPESYRKTVDAEALSAAVEQARHLFSARGEFPREGAEAARKVLAASSECFRTASVPDEAITAAYVVNGR